MLLARGQEVVEERDIEFEHLDELDDAAVRDAELTVEVERARIAVGAEFRDAPIVDVTGQLRAVLVLLVLRLERADADAVLLGDHEALHHHVRKHLFEVALVALQEELQVVARHRREVEVLPQAIGRPRLLLQMREDLGASVLRQQQQRLLVHRRRDLFAVDLPCERVERAFRCARVGLEALLEQAHDRRLARADRTMQQQHAALRPEAVRRRLEHRDEIAQRAFEPEHAVAAVLDRVAEEAVAGQLLLVDLDLVLAIRQDHVVEALVRSAHDQRVLVQQIEILLERALPVLVLELLLVQRTADQSAEIEFTHHSSLRHCCAAGRCDAAARPIYRSCRRIRPAP